MAAAAPSPADTVGTPPSPLQPVREERSHRVIRVSLIVLILLSIVSGYATRPTINGQMRRVLRDSTVVEVVRSNASWNRPFLSWEGRELVAKHRTVIGRSSESKGVTSYFSGSGVYLGSRSVIEPDPYARRQSAELERALMEAGETYASPETPARELSVAAIFQRIQNDIDVTRLRSFEVFPVTFKTVAEGEVPALVVHLWCEPQVAPAPVSEAKHLCGQAERIVLRLDTDEIIRRDSLL